jgi:HSP20 family protein
MLVKFNQPSTRAFNGLFNDLLQDFSLPQKWESEFSKPKVNIKDTNDFYELEVVAPGISKEDFKINIEKNLLTISYDVKEEKNEQTEKFIKREFTTQSFKRSFTLDEKIEADHINAKYENGILKLQLPKKEEVKISPKEIAVL